MDCTKPGFDSYVWSLHSFTIVSVPLYTVAIVGLLRIHSTYFERYKHYLVWHTVINFLSEIYNSWFLLPVVHLPHPLLRMTGIMTYFGFSGLFQFYVINGLIYRMVPYQSITYQLIPETAYSILEMFMFRFRASLYTYKTSWFYVYLRLNIYAFRLIMITFLLIAGATFSYAIEIQGEYREEIIRSYPNSPLEILCFSVVIARPFSDLVSLANISMWVMVIMITFTATSTTTFYLNKCLREGEHHSAAVVRMQKMLLVSLFVQTAIHGIMLGAPNVLFVYAAFFGAHHETLAHWAFLFLTSHGFFSTLAMIIFTRPIRISITRMLKCWKPVHVESTRYSDNKL